MKKYVKTSASKMTAALCWVGLPMHQAAQLAKIWKKCDGRGMGGWSLADDILLLSKRGVRVDAKSVQLILEAGREGELESMAQPIYHRLRKLVGVLPEPEEEENTVASSSSLV